MLAGITSGWAQPVAFANYMAADGLSDNNALCSVRDRYGFVWIGTNNGLNCFDGAQNTVYRNMIEGKSGIENNTITALYEHGDDIWFGGSFGLYVYDRQANRFRDFDKQTKYGVSISAAVQDAREAAALGSLTYSIDAAEITVPDAVFNRRQQLPKVTVTLNGETLTPDEDYILVAEKMLKAGTEEITLLGAGDYVGYAKASFTIVPGESTVRASEAVAAGDLAEGDVTVLTVDTPAHPDNVQFDFSATDPALRDSLAPGSDGKSVVLKKGAAPGTYSIAVNVIGGSADTYANIDGETYMIEVK